MRKVFLLLIVLLAAAGTIFAADTKQDVVKITANVGDRTVYRFTQNEYTNIEKDMEADPVTETGKNISGGSVSFYASAKTNSETAITMKVKATGLTRVVNGEYTSDVVTLTINDTAFSDEAESTYASNGYLGGEKVITFTEKDITSSTLEGYRPFSKQLNLSANFSEATAGYYVAFVTLIADAQ